MAIRGGHRRVYTHYHLTVKQFSSWSLAVYFEQNNIKKIVKTLSYYNDKVSELFTILKVKNSFQTAEILCINLSYRSSLYFFISSVAFYKNFNPIAQKVTEFDWLTKHFRVNLVSSRVFVPGLTFNLEVDQRYCKKFQKYYKKITEQKFLWFPGKTTGPKFLWFPRKFAKLLKTKNSFWS